MPLRCWQSTGGDTGSRPRPYCNDWTFRGKRNAVRYFLIGFVSWAARKLGHLEYKHIDAKHKTVEVADSVVR